MTKKSKFLVFALFGLVCLSLAAPAFAGDATVTNNGSGTAFVRTKTADGQYGLETVPPGGSVTLDASVVRVRINGGPNVSITKRDGTTQTLGDGDYGKSLLVGPEGQRVAVRTSSGTTVMPPASEREVNSLGANVNQPIGVGLGPAASDGPVTYTGTPLGQTKDSKITDWDTLKREWELTDDNIAALKKLGQDTPQKADQWLLDLDAFFDYVSGSGGMFGDNVGPSSAYGVPRNASGNVYGSGLHFGRTPGGTIFSNDLLLISALNNNDSNTFKTLFDSEFGEFKEERF